MLTRSLYAASTLLTGLYCLFFITFGLREFIMLFEGMSLQLPLPTRILIGLSRSKLIFTGGFGGVLAALIVVGWTRSGTTAFAVLQALVFFFACLIVLACVLPMLQLVGNLGP